MKIATWNVNSLRARLPRVTDWLAEAHPDVLLVQETKVQDEDFPSEIIEDLGYNTAVHGQKSYNGVAIFSKFPIEDISRGLPGDDQDTQARYIECFTGGARVASIYLPNGNPYPGEKFEYKLSWMKRLVKKTSKLLENEEVLILGGDFNVCPTDDDVYDPQAWVDDALCRIESRNHFRELLNLGLTNAFRTYHAGPGKYSYWDYTRGAWQKDFGLLIDHLLLSPEAADRLSGSGIDKGPRGKEKPSDHTPVWCELEDHN
jgi:exodeoxyribonuclease-3